MYNVQLKKNLKKNKHLCDNKTVSLWIVHYITYVS